MTTTTDRCDRCGARAQRTATLPSGLSLAFCGHHYREHWEALLLANADISPDLTTPALA